jgi:hypothetical protein
MEVSTEGVPAGSEVADARDVLIGTIVDEVRRCGYFLVYVDPHPFQRVIDLRWAAQNAGRALGRRLRTYTSAVGAQQKGLVSVVVAPANIPAQDRVQVMVDRIVSAPGDHVRVRHAS